MKKSGTKKSILEIRFDEIVHPKTGTYLLNSFLRVRIILLKYENHQILCLPHCVDLQILFLYVYFNISAPKVHTKANINC